MKTLQQFRLCRPRSQTGADRKLAGFILWSTCRLPHPWRDRHDPRQRLWRTVWQAGSTTSRKGRRL